MGSRALRAPRAGASMPPAAAIDRAYLARFTLGNESLAREVLELFAAQAPLYLEALQRASTDRGWREAAHTLRGAAGAVGARQLQRLAELAERVGRGPPGAAREAERELAIGVIKAAVAAACREIADMFAP
jgi:HPt (histidine-containing phosphotransfer) domain-containing protein